MFTCGPACFSGGASQPVVTWDPSYKGTDLVLSNGNLTVTMNPAKGNWSIGLANGTYSTGKYMFGSHIDQMTSNAQVGMGTHNIDLSSYLGHDANSCGLDNLGTFYIGGGTSSTGLTFAQGDIVVGALDFATGKFWIGKIHSGTLTWASSGNPGAGTNPIATLSSPSTWYPAYGVYSNLNEAQTAKFKNADLTGFLPTGFTAWSS